jgi:hypothetical protein
MSHISMGDRSIAADQFNYRPWSTEQLAYLSRTNRGFMTRALEGPRLLAVPRCANMLVPDTGAHDGKLLEQEPRMN